MFGLDAIGGVWQDIGEWLIILFMFISTAWFWSFITSIVVGVVGGGNAGVESTSSCNHNLIRNPSTGIYSCTKCPERFT